KFNSKTKPALPFDKVKNIAYDSYGDVWIGGHSLARWNSRKQLFDTLITVYGGANKFNDDIRCLSADANGSLWIHNAYNGLLQYQIKEKKFIAYSMNDGLPSDVVKSISPVINDILWIGSHNHLTRFDTRTKKMVIYDHLDGLPDSWPTGINIDFDKAGDVMYMCNNEYLVKFPFEQNNSFDSSSDLMIQELIVNNRKNFFQPAGKLNLKYNENNLTINFTIIDFEKTNYQFSYRVNNADNWHVLGLQRSLSLNNLQPGEYNIQVKATGRSGNEKIQELVVTIRPPYWKTAWFLVLISLITVATFFFLYRKRIRRIRQKADIDRLLAQTEMKALHAQMNPHFIFNSLNSIREMILNCENKEASHFLSKFAHLIRITLDQSGQTFISLRNTVDYLERYIEMEQIRNSHFTCNIKTDEALDMDETILPPMLIQPFIENAIWHGASGNRRDIVIKVEFKKEGDKMTCTIDDNGIGVNQSLKNKPVKQVNHKPVGIANIENRIKLLNEKYELHSTIRITDKKDLPGNDNSGTIVILQLPLEIKET
ncbi:MAG: histidine kinase, partial [Ferruginibacter sp.]